MCYEHYFGLGLTGAAWMPLACAAVEGEYAYDPETGEHLCTLPHEEP